MIILAVFLTYFSNVLKVSKINSSTGRNQIVQEFNAEYENSIDVLFAGDSTPLNSLVPAKLWKDTKITSYCLGYNYAYPSEIYFDIKKVFERQKPKVLFLEASYLVGESKVIDNDLYYKDSVNRYVNYIDEHILGSINYVFPVLKYKSSFKNMTVNDLFRVHPHALNNIYKGYSIKTDVVPPPKDLKVSDNNTTLINNAEIYTKKIKKLCDESNCKMVLILVPQIAYWTKTKHNIILKLADMLNVNFIDYNINTDKYIKNFSWNTDTADGGTHLNYSGASKVTNAIKNFLLKETGFNKSSFDLKIINKWNKDSKEFFREMNSKW